MDGINDELKQSNANNLQTMKNGMEYGKGNTGNHK